MKPYTSAATALALLFVTCPPALAVEEAEYAVLLKTGDFEIREYAPSIVAETIVTEGFEDAGDSAFRKLFKYISGENVSREKIAMTAPVSQVSGSEKIAMTAPVSQQDSGEGWSVSFMMPTEYTMETLPLPKDPDVRLREIPAYRAASVRYSGFWSEGNFQEHLEELLLWIELNGLQPAGEPVWARYNPPFTPWFLRRNEILIPVAN